jgi:hypothetical protein
MEYHHGCELQRQKSDIVFAELRLIRLQLALRIWQPAGLHGLKMDRVKNEQ